MLSADQAFTKFMTWLKRGVPFTFVRFNDGEMGVVTGKGRVIARGDQRIDEELRRELTSSLSFRKDKVYWIGGPCPKCYPGDRIL